MFYIRNLSLQTFYFEPLINLMHKLGISWDCNRSGTYFPSLSASINSIKTHADHLCAEEDIHIPCSLSDVSINFLMVPVLLFPKYLYFHLFVLHLSCVKKKPTNHRTSSCFRKISAMSADWKEN